jgi:perosamine synthetase
VVRPHVRMSWFVYVVRLAEGVDRDRVVLAMEAQGVPARAYFPPMHLQPYVRERLGTGPGMLPVTEALARRTLALPFHNHLSEAEIEWVVECLERAVG